MTKIGERAFYNCTSLSSVVIPESVTEIGPYAFGKCESLTSIVIPDNVTEIGYDAFNGSGFTRLHKFILLLRCDWVYARQSNVFGQVASFFNVTNWLSPLKLRKICHLTKFSDTYFAENQQNSPIHKTTASTIKTPLSLRMQRNLKWKSRVKLRANQYFYAFFSIKMYTFAR